MGTDAGCPFNPYSGVPYELVLMHQAGLTAEQALLAAYARRSGAARHRARDWFDRAGQAGVFSYTARTCSSRSKRRQTRTVIHNGIKVD
ncbi:MAG: hypothetical protein R2881_08145 [Eubacteriales bacterium]